MLALLLLAPMGRLAWEGFGQQSGPALWAFLTLLLQDDYWQWRVVWTLVQAGVTCLAALLLGLPIAWVLARLEFVGRTAVLRLLLLPFVVPTLVAALGVLALLGPSGLVTQALGLESYGLQDTPWLLLYGNLFFNLCLVVRAGVDGLENVSSSTLAAARTLGASPWRAFWRVEWPVLQPWLGAGLCLVFLQCFAGFGLALVLGGQRYATVEVEIYTLVAHELKLAEASTLAIGMLLVTASIALVYAWVEKSLATPKNSAFIPVQRLSVQTARRQLALAAALAVLACVCAAPLLAIVWVGLTAGSKAWAKLLEPDVLDALGNTLMFSGIALVLATALGLLHALAAARKPERLWLRAAAFLPLVASPVTVAFGLLLLYPQASASLGLLLAAYALLAYPFVARAVASSLDSLPANVLLAARSLGASPARLFWRVTLPLIRPALRRGMAFAAATALGEFAVTLFLSRPEWATLSTLIYERLGRPGSANRETAMLMSCLLMTLALLAFWAIEWPENSNRPKKQTPL